MEEVPFLVTQATGRLNRDLRTHPRTVERRVYLQPQDNPLLVLPDNLLSMISLRQGGRRVPQYPPAAEDAGISWGYVARGNALHLYPTPTTDTEYQLDYSARLPILSEPTDSNWVLETYPDLYLYATLVESALFLKDKESHGHWLQEYADRLLAAQRQGWDESIATAPRMRAV
jgi:hypothetical protein